MMNWGSRALALGGALLLMACGSEGGSGQTTTTSSGTSEGGAGGGGVSTTSTGGDGGHGGSGGSTTGSGGGGQASCAAARDEALGPIDTVSTGEVSVVSTSGETRTLFIDASAGGSQSAPQNPWIYLSLASGTKAAESDVASFTSHAWDIGLKRSLIRTNGGDGGPGQGGAVLLEGKDFDAVTKAEAESAMIAVESWFDAACKITPETSDAVPTTFAGWYDYDPANHTLNPHPGTFIVRGAEGGLYKLAILDYYANPDGTSGMVGGRFAIRVAEVK